MSIKSLLKDSGLNTFYKDENKRKPKLPQWMNNKGSLIIGIKHEIEILNGLVKREELDDYKKKMVKVVKKESKDVYAFQFMLGSKNLVGRKEQRDKDGNVKTKTVELTKDKKKVGEKEQTMYESELVYLGDKDNKEECANNLSKILGMVEEGKMDDEIERVTNSLKKK